MLVLSVKVGQSVQIGERDLLFCESVKDGILVARHSDPEGGGDESEGELLAVDQNSWEDVGPSRVSVSPKDRGDGGRVRMVVDAPDSVDIFGPF